MNPIFCISHLDGGQLRFSAAGCRRVYPTFDWFSSTPVPVAKEAKTRGAFLMPALATRSVMYDHLPEDEDWDMYSTIAVMGLQLEDYPIGPPCELNLTLISNIRPILASDVPIDLSTQPLKPNPHLDRVYQVAYDHYRDAP